MTQLAYRGIASLMCKFRESGIWLPRIVMHTQQFYLYFLWRGMMRLYLVLFFLIVFSTNANAKYTTMGARSYGQWMEDRSDSANIMKAYSQGWLLGYLSGRAGSENKNFLVDAEHNALFLWMDNYCRNQPLDSVDQAADALVIQLKLKMRH